MIEAKDRDVLGLQELVNSFKINFNENQKAHDLETEKLTRDKELTLSQVEEQVKQALAHKDKIISTTRSKLDLAIERNQNLEHLIEKQRVEFLS